ncbi:hypothetical protein [Methylophilus aquaticus]|uniref:Uncharacterized protein n=1 Tax=Methylophilus aquaticus TaxID=1971610 RepID=A0ABT9JTV4_9PROT|nr:hypothetical protein [Methylophilus aquaticus]MDP8567966.1 hypothetical protein [Methylophilus aquaticus]
MNFLSRSFTFLSSKILHFFSSDLGKTVLTYILIPLCIFSYQSIDQNYKNERLRTEKEESRLIQIKHLKLEFSYRLSQAIGRIKTIGNEFKNTPPPKKSADFKKKLNLALNDLLMAPEKEVYCLFNTYCEKSAIAIIADLIVLQDKSGLNISRDDDGALKNALSQLNNTQQLLDDMDEVSLKSINELIVGLINSQKIKESSAKFWKDSMVFPYLDCKRNGKYCTVNN